MDKKSYEILIEAEMAGYKAAERCKPTPMTVVSGNTEYVVNGGVCGFAWVNVLLKNAESRKFINDLKKSKLATSDINSFKGEPFKKSTDKGYIYWCSLPTQSMAIKEEFCRAFAKVLKKHNIVAYSMSRID